MRLFLHLIFVLISSTFTHSLHPELLHQAQHRNDDLNVATSSGNVDKKRSIKRFVKHFIKLSEITDEVQIL